MDPNNFTLKDYVSYWEAAANSNKILRHKRPEERIAFKRIDIEEVLAGIKADIKDIFLCLESPEVIPGDLKSDNIRAVFDGGLMVLHKADPGNHDSKIDALDVSLSVCFQLMAKVKNDVMRYRLNKAHPFKLGDFDFARVRFNKVGPVFTSFYGYRITFSFNQKYPNGGQLNDNDWFDDKNYKTDL